MDLGWHAMHLRCAEQSGFFTAAAVYFQDAMRAISAAQQPELIFGRANTAAPYSLIQFNCRATRWAASANSARLVSFAP